MRFLRKSKLGSFNCALALAIAMAALRLLNAAGEIFPSMVSSAAQSFWPSARQRQNFTASAGTNSGALASLGEVAIILKRPVRSASGTDKKKSISEPLCDSRAAKLALFNPIAPEAASVLSHGICGTGLGASGFGSGGGMPASTLKKVFALNQPKYNGESRNCASLSAAKMALSFSAGAEPPVRCATIGSTALTEL